MATDVPGIAPRSYLHGQLQARRMRCGLRNYQKHTGYSQLIANYAKYYVNYVRISGYPKVMEFGMFHVYVSDHVCMFASTNVSFASKNG